VKRTQCFFIAARPFIQSGYTPILSYTKVPMAGAADETREPSWSNFFPRRKRKRKRKRTNAGRPELLAAWNVLSTG
jgi:hypothetical protein